MQQPRPPHSWAPTPGEAKPVAFWGGLGLEGQGRREEAGMQGGSGCGEQEQAAQAISTVWFLGRKISN